MNDLFISLDTLSSPKNEKIRVERAWEHFIFGKDSASKVRPLTYQSWKRSLKHGVHPLEGKAPLVISEEKIQEYQSSSLIYSTLEPLLINLKNSVKASGYLIVFCNENGEIVYLDGDQSLKRKAENINFIAGSSWSEHHAGTNGMGAALATGNPMQVFAGEHFCQQVHNWVCSAAPIKDPATKKVLGAINLTGIWDTVHPHSLTTVISAAQLIEQKLLNHLKFEQFLLMEHYIEVIGKNPNKNFAVLDRGCSVIKASPLYYEKGWLDKNSHVIDLDKEALWKENKYRWEMEKRDGIWTFEVIPYFFQGYRIGAVLHAIPPVKLSKKTGNSTKHSFTSMIGQSDEFISFITEARSVASIDLPVLIEGESGTGKELLAQSIHSSSLRSSEAFVAVNCGAIPKELAASELFGYEEGTFTGGQKGGRSGKFQLAEGGTIFLDEIGEMPLDLQTMLLRILEEGEVVRLGGTRPIKLNVRVIAATNCDLKKACEEGKFRKDLYYRLNILSLQAPPLRERSGDIPVIFEHLLKKICIELGRPPLMINDQALLALERYDWPGNVRELRNFSYKMAVKVKGNMITSADLPKEFTEEKTVSKEENPVERSFSSQQSHGSKNRVPSLKEQELNTILAVLDELNGNVTETAKRLGIHRSTIYKKLARRDSVLRSLK
ncbi:sigma-54-dependent Fis family transcriptional regulator [Alkalihalobacterium alkalinitrilicum]|uniref:sigma-54-dependent Fis family transcriptional regulator n=1 Tax=Alkalihalobacterium alkalinitrilicum TaxID=427920 RepID=UPI0009956B2E|nr:sigma-54-dependent Fis family transcriptional regulator [Alkalihalobacterium alkalinitrilicum]